jgi:hypothetical protein
MKKTLLLAVLLELSALPLISFAAGTVLPPEPSGGYGICDLLTLIDNCINIFIKILIPAFAALVLAYAGFKMLLNQGNSDVAKQTKDIALAVVIGIVVMFASYAIVGTILVGMGASHNALNWAPTCTR